MLKMRKRLLAQLREIYHRYEANVEVSEEDVNVLRKYVDPYLHHRKKRMGITTKILTTDDNLYKSIVFNYYNDDGESSTASLPSVVRYYFTGNVENAYRRFYEACRCAVGQQIVDHKKSLVDSDGICVSCPLCGGEFGYGETHTDHFPVTFKTLVKRFFNGNYSHPTKKVGIYTHLESEELESGWKEYHLKHAKYRDLCHNCHKINTGSNDYL